MTLTDILNALNAASAGGSLNLYGTDPDPNWPLRNLINAANKFGPSPSVSVITRIVTQQTVSSVVLTGSATLAVPDATLIPAVPMTVTLTATLPTPDDAQFQLVLSVAASSWTFGATFPTLPDSQLGQNGLVSWQPSFMGPLLVQHPVFFANSLTAAEAASIGFSGSLPIAGNGVLDDLKGWIGPLPLPVAGTILMPQTAQDLPAMDLKARISGAKINVGTLTVQDLSLWLQCEIGLDADIYSVTSLTSLSLSATMTIGAVNGFTATLSSPMLQGDYVWPLYLAFDGINKPTLSGGLLMLSQLFDGMTPAEFPVPSSLPILDDFTFETISVGLVPPTAAHPLGGLTFVAVTLGSDKTWVPPVPFVRINNVGTRWVLTFGGDPYAYSLDEAVVSGTVYGDVVIGGTSSRLLPRFAGLRKTSTMPVVAADGNTFTIAVNALIPQYVVTGTLATDDTIPLDSALEFFFGGSGPDGPFKSVAITAFSFSADPSSQTYQAQATVTTDVVVPLGSGVSITLLSVGFWIDVTQGSVAGGLSGIFVLTGGGTTGQEDPMFVLAADYMGTTANAGWTFSGQLYPGMSVNLTQLVTKFMDMTAPAWVPQILLDRLAFSFNTTTGGYMFAGTASARWPAPILGIEGGIAITASADILNPDGNTLTGTLGGSFQIGQIEVALETDLSSEQAIYRFIAKFNNLLLTVTTGQRTSKGAAKPHQVLYARLGGVTLGSILEYLVNLAAPTIGYTLDSPWDLLNRIDLSRFQLMFDPTDNVVELTCDVGADIVVMRIDTIGVRYWKPNGKSTVELILEGNFLGKSYAGDDALAWDVINDPPPAVPGQGFSLVDIRYLGLGQRIAFDSQVFNSLDTVRDFLNALTQQMGEVKDPSVNPLTQNPGMAFSADSQWLIGFDITLMDTVDLGFLFNDPKLYGLSIALHGEKAQSFAGLDFEILYKKISSDVGMFRIELRLPDQFRHFEMGEVSITLGIVVVEIYTNGNFMIDMGFPHDRNYDRSFSVEVFPFLGRGGFYFGLLDGTTSSRAPKISNGTFAPVIEVGLGLAVGVGKDISFGPLSGGAYLQVEAAFQGVLAWYNPSNSSTSSDMYYWMQAIVAIHGRIYGQVDFVIVKASANIEAYAEVSVILEAYRASLFRLNAYVRVSARVKILFVSISFSFSAEIDVSFTVGSDSRTPWILSSDQGSTSLPAPRRSPPLRKRALARRHLLSLAALHPTPEVRLAAIQAVMTGNPAYVLTWNPDTTVFATARNTPLCIIVSGSVSSLPSTWGGQQAPSLPTAPDYRLAFVVSAADGRDTSAESGAEAAKKTRRSAAQSAQASGTADLPLDTLMEALLRWSITAIVGDATTISAGQLDILAQQISWSETTDAFSLANLSEFFSRNIVLQISGPPTDGTMPNGYSASVLPMPPFLSWTSTTQLPDRDFNAYNKVGALYEWGANSYFTQFQTSGGDAGTKPGNDDPAAYESMASYVFRDWCLMLARTAVQSAVDQLAVYPYNLQSQLSLADIATALPTASVPYNVRANDTVDSVASSLGVTSAELAFQNPGIAATLAAASPGTMLDVVIGTAPGEIAADNPDLSLQGGVTVALGDVDYQVPANATFNGIATQFGLTSAQDLFTGTTLAVNTTILQAGATFTTKAASYPNPQGFILKFTAAIFYVRFADRTDITDGILLGQSIFQLNSGTGQALADWSDTIDLPTNVALIMPPGYAGLAAAATYTPLSGDTLARLGAALALASGSDASDAEWQSFYNAVVAANSGWTAGSAVALPALPITGGLSGVTVALGESLTTLALRTILYANAPTGLLTWVADQAILAPLAILTVPSVQFTTGTTPPDTFQGLAGRYGMSVNDLGTLPAVANNAALLYNPATGTTPVVLTIYHLPAQTVADLVSDVMGGVAPGQAAGLTARQLLSGQSLPAPETDAQGYTEATGPLTALYDLTGQQVPGPAPDLAAPAAVAAEVSVTVDAAYQSWVVLLTSSTVGEGETLDQLRTRIPRLEELNPALAMPDRFGSGMLVHADLTSSLPIQFTNTQLAAMYPQTGLLLNPTQGPQAMPMTSLSPRPYGLDHQILVQAPAGFAFIPDTSSPLVGTWSLWPFPDELVARAQTGAGTLYELVQRYSDTSRPQTSDIVSNATWATVISFQIRQMSGYQDIFELLGADTVDRQTLLEVWNRLSSAPADGYLLYAPAPSNDQTTGIIATQPDNASTFIVKTNLSTETQSGVQFKELTVDQAGAPADTISTGYYANFGELTAFCTLLWEASVVGGSGYTFSFRDINGNGLPDSCFNQSGVAVISLMVLDATQLAPAPAGRALISTNNYALAAPGLDASTNTLYMLSTDGKDDIDTPAYPAGNIGFTVTMPQATTGPDATAQDLLAAQFSLLTYNVAACTGTPFTPTDPAPPMNPQEEDGSHQTLAQRQRMARRVRAGIAEAPSTGDTLYWRYDQVLPLYRFGPASVAPPVPGLPSPASDPYRGAGTEGTLVPARIQLDAVDVFGNVTAPSGDGSGGAGGVGTAPPGAIDYSLGYYDPLISPSSWPGTTLAYSLAQTSGKVELAVTLSPQPAVLAPNPQQVPATLAARAQLQSQCYQDIYYQLVQTGVTPQILSTLQTSQALPVALTVDQPQLALRYAAANYVYASAVALAVPVKIDTQVANTLTTVMQEYGTGPYLMGSANGDALIYQAFGAGTLTAPVGVAFAENDTPQSIVDAAKAKSTQGWPAPADGAALLEASANANILLLRPQAVLSLPPESSFTVPQEASSLSTLAADVATSVALLAADIAAQTTNPPAFASGFVFDYEGYSVTTSATVSTFAQVIAAFAALGIICQAADLAVGNELKTGIFAAGTVLPTGHLVAGNDQTFNDAALTSFTLPLTPALTLQTLAQANTATRNLFDSGALVYLGSLPVTLSSSELRTVSEFAAAYGSEPGLLMAANLGVSLPSTTVLTVPGAIAQPTSAMQVPFGVKSGDTLDTIATNFAATAMTLATANAAMPYVIAGNQQIQIKTANVSTQTGWSIDTLWNQAKASDASVTFADTVSAIEADARALQAGALLVCPPAAIPASGNNLTVDAAALRYNVDSGIFVQANAGTLGLIAANVPLTASGLATPITTGQYDTFNSIVARFADAGQPLSISDILAANPNALLIAKGKAALLPPPVSILTAGMPPNAGPFPSPVFPLYVWLRIARPGAAIPTDVDAKGAVAVVDAVVPAPTSSQGPEGATSQTYDAFSAAFELALPQLRLATGKVESQTTDLWAVDFGASGISSVAVSASLSWQQSTLPRIWALRPLYNRLQTRMDVPVSTVLADGSLSTPGNFNFQNVDPETWASRILADIDVFLSSAYAAMLYSDAAVGRDQLKRVLDAKKLLAPAIARGLYPVLDIGMPQPAGAQTEAQAMLEDKLAAGLSATYAMSALLQYDAAVTSAWTQHPATGLPARLSGATRPATPLPDDPRPYTLTGAKTDVSTQSSYVSFVMTVPDVAVSSHVPVNLDYFYDEIEFDIRPVSNVDGYVSSNWLSFMPSLESNPPSALSTDLGPSEIPVPLRAYPPLPALKAQSGTASYQIATSLDQTNLWTFGVTYAHQHAEQDEAIIGIDFNLASGMMASSRLAAENIVNALASYSTAADGLWALLPGWVNKTRNVPLATLQNAAQSFAELVTAVASAWDAHWPLSRQGRSLSDEPGDDNSASPYQYHAKVGYEGTRLKTLMLSSIGTAGISPTGAWPDAYFTPSDGIPIKMTYINSPTPDTAVYDFPTIPGTAGLYPARAAQTIGLTWSNLNVCLLQNAKANLAVRRNAKLLGETGPDTNEDFIYYTADIDAENSVWPLLTWPQRFNIGSGPQSNFAATLQTALTQALGTPNGQNITLAVDYGSELKVPTATDPDGVVTYLPVKLYPHVAFSATTAADLEAELVLWLQDHPPSATGGEWAVSLTLYANSTTDDMTTTPGRTLLQIDKMIYQLSPLTEN